MRVAESLALTFAVGCLLAIVPVLILQWRGESIFPLLMALLFLCPLAAVAVLLRNWPTHLVAAAQADRQLRLGELLSTAIQIRLGRAAPAADVLCDAVLAMADERCRTLGPSDVLLRRWGARAWGGLGLSVALLLAAAMIPLRPLRLRCERFGAIELSTEYFRRASFRFGRRTSRGAQFRKRRRQPTDLVSTTAWASSRRIAAVAIPIRSRARNVVDSRGIIQFHRSSGSQRIRFPCGIHRGNLVAPLQLIQTHRASRLEQPRLAARLLRQFHRRRRKRPALLPRPGSRLLRTI